MAKIMRVMTAVVFAMGFLVPNALAGHQAAMTKGKPSSFSSMVGADVLNSKGGYLGRVSNFVVDPQGHVAFVVVSHGGFLRIDEKAAAVPFGSLLYDWEKDHFVLDVTRDKLNMAPVFTKRDLYDEKRAEDMYRYFGQVPYWTEGELVEKGIKPTEEPENNWGAPYLPYRWPQGE